jgi:tight adherence protein B
VRPTRALALLAAALVLLLPVPAALAQQAQSLDVDVVDASAFPDVTMTVNAPQQLVGRQLPDGAFTVTEAGVERTATVRQLPSDDLEVLLLVDTSGSMGTDPMAAARRAAIDFARAMPDGVRLAVVAFANEPRVVSDFTEDRDATEEALAGLESGGYTALYDAVLAGLGLFGDGENIRQAMVLLSDGGDTISDAGLEQARTALLDSDSAMFVVELQTAESDPDALVTLARATGGRVVSTDDPAALGSLYEEIASKLVNRYAVSYESASAGRTEVRIDLRTEDVWAFSSQQIVFPLARAPRPDTEVQTTGVPALAAQIIDVGVLGEPWVAYVGAGVVFAALALALLALLAPRPRHVTLDMPSGAAGSSAAGPPLAAFTRRLVAVTERRLERRGQSGKVARQLERAGIDLRPGEFVVLAVGGSVAAAMLGSVVVGPPGAVLGAAFGVVVGRSLLRYLADRRRGRFAEQLPDTLQLMSGSLRTGYGIMQALDAVVREADEPTASEFSRLMTENRLGRDLTESLSAMAQRIELEDFDWVVQAIGIHRDVGGDLAEVLDRVGETIRERDQIRRQVKALSAEGRLSAVILVGLPIFMAVMISVVQPGYLGELTTVPLGWAMIVTGGVLMVIGTIWVRRLVRLVF